MAHLTDQSGRILSYWDLVLHRTALVAFIVRIPEMAFFKAIWKGHSKHKKLSEEWSLARSQDSELDAGSTPVEGVTFNMKMMGSTLVAKPSSESATAEAVKTIVTMAKVNGRKPKPVQVTVSISGILVAERASDVVMLDVSIYRISYCSADASYGHVFAFIATNKDDLLECYAFLCQKRKMAQLVSISVAQCFNTAYHMWKLTQKPDSPQKKAIICDKPLVDEKENGLNKKDKESKELLIDLTIFSEEEAALRNNFGWMNFEGNMEV